MSGQATTADTNWANLVDEIESVVEDTGMIIWVGSADGRYAMPWGAV